MKGKVVIVVLTFCMLSFSGIVFTVIKSLILDREHLALVEFSKNIEIEVSHSRIKLDDYFLINDTSVNVEILEGLEKAKSLVSSLNSMNGDETKITNKRIIRKFGEILSEIEVHIDRLHELISNTILEDNKTINSAIIREYGNFQKTFLEFENNLHDYIANRNSHFKGKIFTLLFSIFGFLILSLVLIIRLINAYHSVKKQYVGKSIDIEYKERKRIAADLHDGLGSILSSIGLYINLLGKEINQNETAEKSLNQLKQLSDMALESVENAINNLNPTILNKHGLIKSLEIICDKMNDIGNTYFHIESENFDINLSENIELNLFRISNELINNTLKHSEANEAKIKFGNKKKKVFLHYSDNGIGFDPSFDYSNNSEKTGLSNIIKRVETLEGTYSITSEHGKGMRIIIHINTA